MIVVIVVILVITVLIIVIRGEEGGDHGAKHMQRRPVLHDLVPLRQERLGAVIPERLAGAEERPPHDQGAGAAEERREAALAPDAVHLSEDAVAAGHARLALQDRGGLEPGLRLEEGAGRPVAHAARDEPGPEHQRGRLLRVPGEPVAQVGVAAHPDAARGAHGQHRGEGTGLPEPVEEALSGNDGPPEAQERGARGRRDGAGGGRACRSRHHRAELPIV